MLLSTLRKINPWSRKVGQGPLFLIVCDTSLLKTLWKNEKLLLTSIFYFSYSILNLLEHHLPFSLNLKLLSANVSSLEEYKICRLGKD